MKMFIFFTMMVIMLSICITSARLGDINDADAALFKKDYVIAEKNIKVQLSLTLALS